MIYFNKILPIVFSPLFLIIILVIFGLIIGSKKTSLAGIVILVVCSMPIVSSKMIYYLESDYNLNQPTEVDTANAIVVLSGMIRRIKTKNGVVYEWDQAVDRIFAGIDLFKLNKAPILILTGGKLPWTTGLPEGEYLKEVAIKYGIPEENILLTENVENTDQEAKAIKKLFSIDNPRVILVTSAFHMPRAKIVFEAAGINVIPFSVDFRNTAIKTTILNFMPTAHSFAITNFFVREMIGRTYYNLKY